MSQKYRAVIEFVIDEDDEATNAEYAADLMNELKEVVECNLTNATLEEVNY